MFNRSTTPAVARKRFGQHYLVDDAVVDAIIREVAPRADDHILEIGPGGGVLTGALVASGAQVVAVEIDRDLAARLVERYSDAPNFALHNEDILRFDFARLAANGWRWKVVGNLPYNISTPLIMRLLEAAAHFEELTVMVQREVAERLAASPGRGDYGRLSVMAQRRARIALRLAVGPQSFVPPPKVESAVVQLRPFTSEFDPALELLFATLVKDAFGTRRKTITNALRRHCDKAFLLRCGIDPDSRAESLAVADFVRLAEALSGRQHPI